MYGEEADFLGEMIQPKAKWSCPGPPVLFFFSASEKEHPVLTNFTVKTEDITSFELEEECSVLTNFTMKTKDRATFEWENGNVATAYLVKEKDECIYR